MFETELSTFHKNLKQLREENPLGGFVVIKGETILDVWYNDLDALKEGYKAFGEEPFMIKNLKDEPINTRNYGSASAKIKFDPQTFEELYLTIDSQKDQIPSLIDGGFTQTDGSSLSSNNIMLRKYCLEKAIEVFSLKKDFFFTQKEGPLEYAEVLYTYITTGVITNFKLPGMQKENKLPPPTPTPVQPILR